MRLYTLFILPWLKGWPLQPLPTWPYILVLNHFPALHYKDLTCTQKRRWRRHSPGPQRIQRSIVHVFVKCHWVREISGPSSIHLLLWFSFYPLSWPGIHSYYICCLLSPVGKKAEIVCTVSATLSDMYKALNKYSFNVCIENMKSYTYSTNTSKDWRRLPCRGQWVEV